MDFDNGEQPLPELPYHLQQEPILNVGLATSLLSEYPPLQPTSQIVTNDPDMEAEQERKRQPFVRAEEQTSSDVEGNVWTCASCQKSNGGMESECTSCGKCHAPAATAEGWGTSFGDTFKDCWKCSPCATSNPNEKNVGMSCEVPRDSSGNTATGSSAAKTKTTAPSTAAIGPNGFSFVGAAAAPAPPAFGGTAAPATSAPSFDFGGSNLTPAAPPPPAFQFAPSSTATPAPAPQQFELTNTPPDPFGGAPSTGGGGGGFSFGSTPAPGAAGQAPSFGAAPAPTFGAPPAAPLFGAPAATSSTGFPPFAPAPSFGGGGFGSTPVPPTAPAANFGQAPVGRFGAPPQQQ
jgi:hypothetical protein